MRFITLFTFILISFNATNTFAQAYFVKPDGSNYANGTSHATAWKSIKKINSYTFKPGDDVYFLAGGKWLREKLVVDWSGSSSNRVVIGSYYTNEGNEIIDLPVPQGTNKPILDGDYPNIGYTPDGVWDGLVQVFANYVTIRDIRLVNSGGHGVKLSNDYNNLLVDNIDTNVTYQSGISIERRTSNNVVRNSTVRECARGHKDGKERDWPACIAMIKSSNNLIEDNHVYESFGEGIGMYFDGTENNTIRNNKVSAVRLGIYVDHGKNNLIENNLVYGHTKSRYVRSNGYVGNGLAVNTEALGNNNSDATGNIFKNNLVTNVAACFWIGTEVGGYGRVGAKFIGNTCIAAGIGILAHAPEDRLEIVEISNNVIWDIDDTLCQVPKIAGYKIKNNHWQVRPVNTRCDSTDNKFGDPILKKTSGWRELNPANKPEPAYFEPQIGSPLLKAGAKHIDLEQDFYGNTRSLTPSIGAIDSKKVNSVLPPTRLSLSISPLLQ